MRPITRNVAIAILAALALLLALGVVPSLLGTGDPHYVEVTAVTGSDVPGDVGPIDASTLFEESFPYTFGAFAAVDDAGRSDPYRTGPLGLKDAFTHSPFDEMKAYDTQYPNATRDDAVYLRHGDATFRLEVIHP